MYHQQGAVVVDRWLAFKAAPKVAVLLKHLRRALDALLLRKIEKPDADLDAAGGR